MISPSTNSESATLRSFQQMQITTDYVVSPDQTSESRTLWREGENAATNVTNHKHSKVHESNQYFTSTVQVKEGYCKLENSDSSNSVRCVNDEEPTSPQQQEYNRFHYTTHWALIHRYLEQHSRSYGGEPAALATATIFLSLNHDIARFSSSLTHLLGYYPSEILHNHISHYLHPESAFIAASWRNSFDDIVSHLLLSKSEYQRHHPCNTDSHQTSKSCRNLEIGARGTPLFESYMYFYNLRTKSYERFHVCAYLGGALGANLKDCVNIEECYVVWHLFKVDGQVSEMPEFLEESKYETDYSASFYPHGDQESTEEQNKVSKVRDTLSLKNLMSTLKLQSTGAHRVETATKDDRKSNVDQTDIFNPFSSCAHPPYPTDIRVGSESVGGCNQFAR